jgi:hypothetical protein
MEANYSMVLISGFWTVLVENDISHQALIALLFYLMESGQKVCRNFLVYFALILFDNDNFFS